jgi:hypothetical protein
MPWPFHRKPDPEDFCAYLPKEPSSTKSALIAECRRRGVSIFINDLSEASIGIHSNLRAVASEAELQGPPQQTIAARTASRANIIAWLALLTSLASLIVAIFKRG